MSSINRTMLGYLLLIIALGFGVGVLAPQLNTSRLQSLEFQATRAAAEEKEARLNAITELKPAFEQQKAQIERVISALPPGPNIPELFISLETMASQAGIGFDSILPQTNTRDQTVTVTLVGEGPLSAIEAFTNLVAENNRPMSLVSFSLTRQRDSANLSFSLTVLAPYNDGLQSQTGGGQ